MELDGKIRAQTIAHLRSQGLRVLSNAKNSDICVAIFEHCGWEPPPRKQERMSFIRRFWSVFIRPSEVPKDRATEIHAQFDARKFSIRKDFYQTPEWRVIRYTALKRAKGKCQCCASRGLLHVDHIKPRSAYPELCLDPDNLQVLCEDCNLGKGAWDQTDWR